MVLPSKSWTAYLEDIRRLAEKRLDASHEDGFLMSLGLLSDAEGLSERGRELYDALFIHGDAVAADAALRSVLLEYPPAMAVLQLLAGAINPSRANAEAILRSRGFLSAQSDRSVGSLLMLLNHAALVRYQKSTGNVLVLWTPGEDKTTPRSIFISPQTPFGNRAWLRSVLRQCEGFVFWLDKHFSHGVLDDLWSALNGDRVTLIRILSLDLSDNRGRKPLQNYRGFRQEMTARGIEVEWRILDSKNIRDTHDRWIVTECTAWNVPNANAILSGQNSEICQSDSHEELRELFLAYWDLAQKVHQ